jgi:hypothetical protein
LFTEPPVANGVPLVGSVLATVKLDDDSPLATDEVGEVWPDRFLTDNLVTFDLTRPDSSS